MPHSRTPLVEPTLTFTRRRIMALAVAVPVAAAAPGFVSAAEPSAAQRMSEPGPEENVSIMPAWGPLGPQHGDKIAVEFNPQAFVGFGKEVEGGFMVSDMVICQPRPDRTLKEQHVTMADGTGRTWQFVRYEYRRKA
jgi:hypothetical protein